MRRSIAGLLVLLASTAAAQFDTALVLIARQDSSMLWSTAQPRDTLSISAYLRIIHAFHPELRIALASVDRAYGAERAAWGQLDPRLTISASTKAYDGGFKNNDLFGTLSLPLYWGQRLSVDFQRSTEFFNQDYATSRTGEPAMSLRTPLLRNLITDPIRTSINKAEQGIIAADAAYRERKNSVTLAALRDYYTWAGAHARYTVARQLYDIVVRRYQWTVTEIARGERAPIDSIEVLQEVFRRRSLLVRARNAIEQASLALALQLWNPEVTLQTILSYHPEPFPPLMYLDPLQVEFDRARARRQRPELQRLRAEVEQVSLDQQLTAELFKPRLDAKVSLYSPTFSPQISTLPFFWKAGLEFELPLLYRLPSGQVQQLRAQLEQLRHMIALQERRIDTDVILAATMVNATYEQVILARAERAAAETMVRAEQALFERGESDLLRLNLRERLLAEAQEREIEALQAHAIAQAFYRWALADF